MAEQDGIKPLLYKSGYGPKIVKKKMILKPH